MTESEIAIVRVAMTSHGLDRVERGDYAAVDLAGLWETICEAPHWRYERMLPDILSEPDHIPLEEALAIVDTAVRAVALIDQGDLEREDFSVLWFLLEQRRDEFGDRKVGADVWVAVAKTCRLPVDAVQQAARRLEVAGLVRLHYCSSH